MSDAEWEELLSRHFEGELSEEAAKPIWERIASDAQFREQYNHMRVVHHDLRRLLWSNPQRNEAFVRGVLGALSESRKAPEDFAAGVADKFCEEPAPARKMAPPARIFRKASAFKISAAAAAILVLAVTLFFLLRTREIVVATITSGRATVQRNGGTLAAETGFKLNSGDRALTGKDERLTIGYADGSTVEVNSNCDLTVSDAGGAKRTSLEKGAISVKAAKQPAKLSWVLHTPAADATVVGTEFELSYIDNKAALQVTEGHVRFGNAQKEVAVTGGKCSFAVLGRPPSLPEDISKNERMIAGDFPKEDAWTLIKRDLTTEFTSNGCSIRTAGTAGVAHLVWKNPVDLAEGQALIVRVSASIPASGDGLSIQLLDGDDSLFGAKPHICLYCGGTPQNSVLSSLYIRQFTDAPYNQGQKSPKNLNMKVGGVALDKDVAFELTATSTDVQWRVNGEDWGRYEHGLQLKKWRLELGSQITTHGGMIRWHDLSMERKTLSGSK